MWIMFALLGALIGGVAARYRGFNEVGGVIIGAILGVLSPLMFLASNGKKRCAQCAEWIETKAKVCPHCGTPVAGKKEAKAAVNASRSEPPSFSKPPPFPK